MSEEDSKPEKLIVELGFVEKTPAWKLRSKFFPSKIGGYPAWLALKDLPKSDALSCRRCGDPLAFLCQLYAPHHDKLRCFHRTVFVFVCRKSQCSEENNAPNIRVFRSQLPRENDFYPPDPSKDIEPGSESPGAADFNPLCRVCGAVGPKVCGGCKVARYCSKSHQALDWKAGHRAECKTPDQISKVSCRGSDQFLFPEYEISMEPEELEDEKPKTEAEVMQEYETLITSGQIPAAKDDDDSDTEDLIKMATKETDKQFQKFRIRIKDYEDQVVRYDRGGEPLWVSSENKPKDIPPCPACGQPRQFEFQVMPQLLVHLKVDSTGKSIDWGTVLIYSCADSCDQDHLYVEELVYKQDYSPISQGKDVKLLHGRRLFNLQLKLSNVWTVHGHHTLDRKSIFDTRQKLTETGCIKDKRRSGRLQNRHSEEKYETACETLVLSQDNFVQRATAELNKTVISLQQNLRSDFKLYPYKIQAMLMFSSAAAC
ncbi:Programmed cell death protein 2 [Halocaridina rubra]|uniref:Programmed cell death protein 2 n=1 Tax=Halocaridina rubra TaxID=373956 RepID=A0AAN8ZR16_HALRR